MQPHDYAHAERQMDATERNLRAMGEARRRRDGWQPRPQPPRGSGDDYARASLITSIASLVLWPMGFIALMFAWKSTGRGRQLSATGSAIATIGGTIGVATSAATLITIGILLAHAAG